jgi:hypothetical protein
LEICLFPTIFMAYNKVSTPTFWPFLKNAF